jgi:tetratricopeptide (TPR) repeat protein
VSRSADDEDSDTDPGWGQARTQLFSMIMEGRSFSGRERNCLFLNTRADRFATISALSGFDFPDDARGLAVVDWDRDGDQDIWLSNRNAPRLRLLRNDATNSHRFIALRLQGNGSTTSRDSVGARVVVQTSGQKDAEQPNRFIQTLQAGEGFLSQSSKWLHFGLADSEKIEQVTVQWPGGQPQVYLDLDLDSRYRLVQGGPAVKVDLDTIQLPAPTPVVLPEPTRVARIVLETRVLMPTIRYQDGKSSAAKVVDFQNGDFQDGDFQDGDFEDGDFEDGQPTFVNLWASWCAPCVKELAQLTKNRSQLEQAGLRVLALSVDQLGENPADVRDVESLVNKLSLPFEWGYLDARQMQFLQDVRDQFFFLRKPLPLPSSFLVDGEGRLAAIYQGPVSVEQVLKDATGPVTAAGLDRRRLAELAACLPGRTIDAQRAQAVAAATALQRRYVVADWLKDSRQWADAVRHFESLASHKPAWALIRRQLAHLYLKLNQIDRAEGAIVKALELDPKSARASNTFGLIRSRQGNVKQAESAFRHAIALDEEFAGAHNNLGIALAMQGQVDEAGEHFLRAIQLDEEFAKAHANLANVYAASGDANRAVRHYQLAIRLDPQDIEPYNNLGTMYGRLGQIEKAVQYYQHVLKLDPNHAGARSNLERANQLLKSRPQQP